MNAKQERIKRLYPPLVRNENSFCDIYIYIYIYILVFWVERIP